jgi:hypothetical protein
MADDDDDNQWWVFWLLFAIFVTFMIVFLLIWWFKKPSRTVIEVIEPYSNNNQYSTYVLRKPDRYGFDDMWANADKYQRENIQSQIDNNQELIDQKIAEDKRLELLLEREQRITARKNREEEIEAKEETKKERRLRTGSKRRGGGFNTWEENV